MIGTSGTTRLTADGAVGTSGGRIRVFQVTMLAGAGGAGELVLRNGAAASGTVYVKEDGAAASKTTTFEFGEEGMLFPGGCFFDKDTNTAAIVATYRVEQ